MASRCDEGRPGKTGAAANLRRGCARSSPGRGAEPIRPGTAPEEGTGDCILERDPVADRPSAPTADQERRGFAVVATRPAHRYVSSIVLPGDGRHFHGRSRAD